VLAIALALASSVVYGVSDFLGGSRSRSLPLLLVLLVSQASALVILATIVIVRADGRRRVRTFCSPSPLGWVRLSASRRSIAASPSG
jgi:hypothetical protein